MRTIVILIFAFILCSCAPPLFVYKNSLEKLNEGKIKNEEFYAKYYSFYKKTKTYTVDDALLLKCKGSYVCQELDSVFGLYHFNLNGQVQGGFRSAYYPTNKSMWSFSDFQGFYKLDSNRIQVERVTQWNIYVTTFILEGQINGDTILFTKAINKQRPWHSEKMNSVFIYDSTLVLGNK